VYVTGGFDSPWSVQLPGLSEETPISTFYGISPYVCG